MLRKVLGDAVAHTLPRTQVLASSWLTEKTTCLWFPSLVLNQVHGSHKDANKFKQLQLIVSFLTLLLLQPCLFFLSLMHFSLLCLSFINFLPAPCELKSSLCLFRLLCCHSSSPTPSWICNAPSSVSDLLPTCPSPSLLSLLFSYYFTYKFRMILAHRS